MVKRSLGVLIMVLVVGGAATAQTPPAATAPPPQGQTQPAPAPARAPEPAAQLVNIKVELTIVDQTGAAESAKKSVSLIVADRQTGFIRSTVQPKEGGQVQLNVDARPQILPNGNIRLGLSLQYPTLNQSINMILDPGKPLVISQAADPTSDRKISVEVRATLLK
jgi:hypothetical protein